ncbi:MAG: protein kinase [Gemmatimonadota bacterium]|nr:MAG: protein kinase [Gemmatimonadota bacterium]
MGGWVVSDLSDRLRAALADRYALERELGRGGMAVVYLAQDEKLNRPVALKVLRHELAVALGSERFLREIDIAAKLTHPNILAVYDCGEADGQLYYTMPFVEGESLRDRLNREKQLPVEDALQITREVADALGHAHALGIVHRDVKPENILFTAGHAVVSDFGIARAVTAAAGAKLTDTGLAVGTPAYMSPEQASGDRDVDARSDLYSLGCVLYEMLTGETPYTGPTPQAILAKKLTEPTPRISVVREAVPAAIEVALTKALARNAADRFTTAQQFVQALAVDTVAFDRRQRVRRQVRRAAMGMAVVLVVAVTAFAFSNHWAATQWKRAELDPDLLVVMPFRVAATDPRTASLEEGLPELLYAVLSGELGPKVVDVGTRQRKWEDMTRTGAASSADAWFRLAADLGAGLLVSGGLVQAGARLTVNALLQRVPDGEEVDHYTFDVAVDSVSVLPSRLALGLLRDRLGESGERLATLDEQDPDAMWEYLAGMRAYREGRFRDAIANYDRAFQMDSTFALAALRQAVTGLRWGVPEPNTTMGLERVRGLEDRLSGRDRVVIGALRVLTEADSAATVASAIAAFKSWVNAVPGDLEAVPWYGMMLRSGEILASGDWEARSRQVIADAWERDSTTPMVVAQQVFLTQATEDLAWLRRVGPQYLAVADTTGDDWVGFQWLVALALGDSVAVRSLRARAFAEDPRVLSSQVAFRLSPHMLLGLGLPPDDGFLVLDSARSRMLTARDSFVLGKILPHAGLLAGRMQEVAAQQAGPLSLRSDSGAQSLLRLIDWSLIYPGFDSAAQIAAESLRVLVTADLPTGVVRGDVPADIPCYVQLHRVVQGDTVGARAAVRHLLPRYRQRHYHGVCPALVEAIVESYDRDTADTPALDRLEDLLHLGLGFEWTTAPAIVWIIRLHRRRGELDEAYWWVRARMRGWGVYWTAQAALLKHEGDIAALLGDTVSAIYAYEQYLRGRIDPDPGAVQTEVDSVRAALALMKQRWSGRD